MADCGNTNVASISLSQPHSSDEDDTADPQHHHRHRTPRRLPPPPSATKTPNPNTDTSSRDLVGIVSPPTTKKPRGRPPGSKNKPKPPVVLTRDLESSMKPVILEISAGSNLVDALTSFARGRREGLVILSGTGSVSDVMLRHPLSRAPPISLRGPFNLLSLTGSFLYFDNNNTKGSKGSSKHCGQTSSQCHFGITLAGDRGQVFGGLVAGQVLAATLVVVTAATFVSPTFHRLPSEDHCDDVVDEGELETKPYGGGSGGSHEPSSCPTSSNAVYAGGSLSGHQHHEANIPWAASASTTSAGAGSSRPAYT